MVEQRTCREYPRSACTVQAAINRCKHVWNLQGQFWGLSSQPPGQLMTESHSQCLEMQMPNGLFEHLIQPGGHGRGRVVGGKLGVVEVTGGTASEKESVLMSYLSSRKV